METNNATSITMQKYPVWRVLPANHPCVINTYPVYIGKYDGRLKIDGNVSVLPTPKIDDNLSPQGSSEWVHNIDVKEAPKENPQPDITLICHEKEQVKASPEVVIQNQQERKVRYTGDELLTLNISQYNDILEDLIPAEEISVLAGPGGVGKSGFYLHMSINIVLGISEFIGRQLKPKFNFVLIIATEDNEKRLASRIKKIHKKISPEGKSIENLIIITTGEDLNKSISQELEKKSFDLVVIDALTDILDSDQNSPTDVRQFYNNFETLIREFHTAFLFVTHVNKSPYSSGRNRILGSTAIVDRARSVLMMEKDKTGVRTIKIEKSNNISDDKLGKPIKIRLDPENLTFSLEPVYYIDQELESETSLAAEICKKQQAKQITQTRSPIKKKKGKPGRKLDEAKIYEAGRLYKEGLTYEEIGKKLGRNKATIWKWLNVIPPNIEDVLDLPY